MHTLTNVLAKNLWINWQLGYIIYLGGRKFETIKKILSTFRQERSQSGDFIFFVVTVQAFNEIKWQLIHTKNVIKSLALVYLWKCKMFSIFAPITKKKCLFQSYWSQVSKASLNRCQTGLHVAAFDFVLAEEEEEEVWHLSERIMKDSVKH